MYKRQTFGTVELTNSSWRLQFAPLIARSTVLRSLYASGQDNDIAEAYAKMQREAFTMSDRLGALIKVKPGQAGSVAAIDSAFAPLIAGGELTTGLGKQLYQTAKMIAGRTAVQGNRQIFFASLNGFDTHSAQVGENATVGAHALLLKEFADALACFYNAMNAIGMGDAVTTFTQSDFGRTFAVNNSSGTDHAWGNHQLVVGGAVKGSKTYGVYPTLELGGPDDVGVDAWEKHGRWIPTFSVDQYASTLLGWFGASEAQIDAVLPNLRNYGTARRLGFI